MLRQGDTGGFTRREVRAVFSGDGRETPGDKFVWALVTEGPEISRLVEVRDRPPA